MAYKTKEWRNEMRVTVDFNYMMSKSLGDQGIKDSELRALKERAEQAFDYVAANRGRDDLFMGWTELPYNQDAIVNDIIATAKEVRKKFKYFVVLGIGGSALGPIMAFNALKHLHYNELSPKERGGPKFYVEDNVDPVRG
ncbi:MAG: glucose-6-phosphate isomerase, partial [Clostridia bacterium]|nr:glucose-6-phosphate isomerase [Clostridia bacterium]